MLNFKPVQLQDKNWYDRFVRIENTRSADFNFGNIYMWDPSYKQELAVCEQRIVTKLSYEHLPFYAFPIGSGPLKPVIHEMHEHARSEGWNLRISGITEENRQLLEQSYPGAFLYEEEPYADYIYRTEDLAYYRGKKYHGKKNHCNRFETDFASRWDFVPLSSSILKECLSMLDRWIADNAYRLQDGIGSEREAIVRGFASFDELGLFGGALRVDAQIVGFTVGEKISTDTCDVHFEKAVSDMNGAYPMVAREFSRMLLETHPEIIYLNREDDMGQESLRKSKLSMHPACILKKYTARYKND